MLIATVPIALPDLITFLFAAVAALVGAGGVILLKNPVHSALMLVMTLFSVAILFIEEQAQFLAAVQIIVYAGAIVVLFLFVIMLLGVDRKEVIQKETLKAQRPLAVVAAVLALLEISLLARTNWATGAKGVTSSTNNSASNIVQLGRAVFTTYLLPFEATSALLVIAVIGAVVLARRSSGPQQVVVDPEVAEDAAEANEQTEQGSLS
ncbi:MAG: NADH-quinone oxidoreductase subunit J [Acidimicrobiaceae bacterium]|nr:NADH-quinone oxidoreductase subunit J [Acidimicrobiaceae bacterium]